MPIAKRCSRVETRVFPTVRNSFGFAGVQNLPRRNGRRNLCAYPHPTWSADASAEKVADRIAGMPSPRARLGPRGFLRPSKPGSVYNLVERRRPEARVGK
jgi:hypothetical protein